MNQETSTKLQRNTYILPCWPVDTASYIATHFMFVEKLLRPLQILVVPVVYAAKDVHKIAPPHSYVDVRDFKSPKHLADYLLYLDKNHTAYMAYFDWKKKYGVVGKKFGYKQVFCEFCQYIHSSNTPRIMDNFTKWFFEESDCKSDIL